MVLFLPQCRSLKNLTKHCRSETTLLLWRMKHTKQRSLNRCVFLSLDFYDALTKPQAIKDFYENEELIAITKELADTLRRNKTIDWQKRESARAKMRMLIKKLLKKHKYPPEGMEDAVQTVMTQCELWTDNNDMGEEKVVDFRKAGYTYMQEKNDVLMVAEKREVYGDMETKIVKD